ncbi:MAG: uroporphyrinogen decarboxylase [Waddliaceae bacterium]|nr:uroporphyrinogen decarboxylase [Waddliaceae bacterium]
MNDRLLKALKGQNEGRPPVWLMRQAGRYMPEYRAIRAKYDFLEMCHQAEIAAEVTLLPIRFLDPDAAILFSDILTVVEALGLGLHFKEKVGPVIERPVRNAADVARLVVPKANESLSYVSDAIKILRKELKVPLIGFCGAPYTVASYMVEGGSSRNFLKTKRWIFQDPESFHLLMETVTKLTIDYLKMQIEAGAQVLQIFDSWADSLAHEQFLEFSLKYIKKIVDSVKGYGIPLIVFCRGTSMFAQDLMSLEADCISIDWHANLAQLRKELGSVCLQGNMDPTILYASESVIEREATKVLDSMADDPAFIFNLGHGIVPDLEPEKVKHLVQVVKAYSPHTAAL